MASLLAQSTSSGDDDDGVIADLATDVPEPTAAVATEAGLGGLTSTALGCALVTIILAALIGNVLVIASVLRYRRLRTVANAFLVSLAVADFLVAGLVMPFSAVQLVAGRWPFGRVTCDLFNANDVLFSTASLLHLGCVSVDRYVAVTDPFGYDRRMSRRRVGAMLVGIWAASGLLSHVPIHLGWYSATALNDDSRDERSALSSDAIDQNGVKFRSTSDDDDDCSFEVNRIYVFVSSGISFWAPATVMVFTYVKIFREARRQDRRIRALRCSSSGSIPSTSVVTAVITPAGSTCGLHKGGGSSSVADPFRRSGSLPVHQQQQLVTDSLVATSAASRRSTLLDLTSSYGRRLSRRLQTDNKAARTLGIIMGAFIICWLPFFTWYLVSTLCSSSSGPSSLTVLPDEDLDDSSGDTAGLPPRSESSSAPAVVAAAADSQICVVSTPPAVVAILFWVGYANSALNPFIYAAFNREFRSAFKTLLGSICCCCCYKYGCQCRQRHNSDRLNVGGSCGRSVHSDFTVASPCDNVMTSLRTSIYNDHVNGNDQGQLHNG